MFAKVLGIVLVIQLCGHLARSEDITCLDMKKFNVFGNIMYRFSSAKRTDFEVDFHIATRKHRDHVRIDLDNLETFRLAGFDPSLETIIIIHGYKSGGTKKWVVELKNKLLDAVNANILMVDWSRGSYNTIYVDSARATQVATNKIFNFLQALRPRIGRMESSSNDVKWNHLYFIGHSLGAHISGQVANLLKKDSDYDKFWTVTRITGLDPAKPCFTDIDLAYKLDKDDAQFVDIIHTQVGTGRRALGLGEQIGHIDFYVNGGVMQPECHKSLADRLTNDLEKEICSHRYSYKYFTNAVAESVNGGCSFLSYAWDGSYEDADKILKERINGVKCADCPQMGLDTPNSPKRGMFIVITSEAKPYCMKDERHLNFSKVAKVIQKLKGATSIFSRSGN